MTGPGFGDAIAAHIVQAVILLLIIVMGFIGAVALVYAIPWFLAHIRLGWV